MEDQRVNVGLGDWLLVKKEGSESNESSSEKDLFAGVTLMAEKASGQVVFLSTRNSPVANRWSVMPSLECFRDSLRVLDLHKSRYLQSLNDNIGELNLLNQLMLTRCSRLERLPDSIGHLTNLIEVRNISEHHLCTLLWTVRSYWTNFSLYQIDFFDSNHIAELPESIGGLKRCVFLLCT
jgi:hypothetical protein